MVFPLVIQLSDGATTDHEVTVVIDANTVGIKEGGGTAVTGNGFTKLHSHHLTGTHFQLEQLV